MPFLVSEWLFHRIPPFRFSCCPLSNRFAKGNFWDQRKSRPNQIGRLNWLNEYRLFRRLRAILRQCAVDAPVNILFADEREDAAALHRPARLAGKSADANANTRDVAAYESRSQTPARRRHPDRETPRIEKNTVSHASGISAGIFSTACVVAKIIAPAIYTTRALP